MSGAAPRILMWPVDGPRGASTRYRVLAFREGLHAAGYGTHVRYPLGLGTAGLVRRLGRVADLTRDVLDRSAADLLFVHRKTYPPPLAGWLRRPGRPVVFDLDDALDLPPPGRTLGASTVARYRRNFLATVRAADLVLCGNRELASKLPHDRYELVPTAIDTTRFAPGEGASPPRTTLGWVGHSDNLAFLESLQEPLREVARRHAGLRLIVVADRPPRLEGLDVEFRKWSLESERSCFEGIGVGLMPLQDTPWTRGKCAFKAIQCMALGIPVVVSPVGMNIEVVQDGDNGFRAGDAAEWVQALDRLLSDTDLATRLGRAGRETVIRHYSLDAVLPRWLGALERVLSGDLRRRSIRSD